MNYPANYIPHLRKKAEETVDQLVRFQEELEEGRWGLLDATARQVLNSVRAAGNPAEKLVEALQDIETAMDGVRA